MGGKKNNSKQEKPTQTDETVNQPSIPSKQSGDEKKFVNLLHVYTIYKQKLRRISEEEFKKILCQGGHGKKVTLELCKELMKAKGIPNVVSYIENVGFLSVPRLMPLIALLAERSEYKIKPSLVSKVDFAQTPERFRKKFAQLLVYGFWFLGRVISDSLSIKEQINRGNMFNFAKGDMGYWWAGVKILDWNGYVQLEKFPVSCHTFVNRDPPKHRLYTSSAIFNMHQHPLYFLSESDWINFSLTIKSVKHPKVLEVKTVKPLPKVFNLDTDSLCSFDEPSFDDTVPSTCSSVSDVESYPRNDSELSFNTLASRDSSVD